MRRCVPKQGIIYCLNVWMQRDIKIVCNFLFSVDGTEITDDCNQI